MPLMDREPLLPSHLPPAESAPHPVLQLLLRRAHSGYHTRSGDDGHCLALCFEGGGAAGMIPAAASVVLEQLGLTGCFDRVYGSSTGALAAAYFAAGQQLQAGSACEEYFYAVQRGAGKVATRIPAGLRWEALFQNYVNPRPLEWEALQGGPELRLLAYSLDQRNNHTLQDFADRDELAQAMRASSSLPRITADQPVSFRGQQYIDGAMGHNGESLCFGRALDEGATHVLVLRAFSPSHRKRPLNRSFRWWVRWHEKQYSHELIQRQHIYNQELDRLRQLIQGSQVAQVAPERSLLGLFSFEHHQVLQGMRAGVLAMSQALGMGPLRISWAPLVQLAEEIQQPWALDRLPQQ